MRNPAIICLIVFVGFFGFMIHRAAPSVTVGDSGEFITAASTFSIPHAPSYPLYVLLGKLWVSAVPFGTDPLRVNTFSCLTAALSLAVFFLLGVRLSGSSLFSFLSTFLAGISSAFLENSLVAEVFSLNTLIFLIFLWLCTMFIQTKQTRYLFGSVFILGLGLGNHHILLFAIPGLLWIYLRNRNNFALSQLIVMGFLFLLAASTYLVLPIRSAKEPELNWGKPTTVQRFIRTITRKDYGSLKMSIGETPQRDVSNTLKQLTRFQYQMSQQIPWFVLVLGLVGLFVGLFYHTDEASFLLLLWLLFGPFFYLLGNLPFNGQSLGMMERFLIIPTLLSVSGLFFLYKRGNPFRMGLVALFAVGFITQAAAVTMNYRTDFLAYDYANTMMRTVPPHSALYLEGGDDAFYSLATQQMVMRKRPDIEIHDRGGLIFKNPYGDDFRSLSKDDKEKRRIDIELNALKRKPLFYSSMDANILPGVPMRLNGILIEAGTSPHLPITQELMLVRGVYSSEGRNYRSRALACYFPYCQARTLWATPALSQALRFIWRAQLLGFDVGWIESNIEYLYAHWGYELIQKGRYVDAEKIYRQWIRYGKTSEQPMTNLGVALEKQGREKEAEEWYCRAIDSFPKSGDAAYNMAVLEWRRANWPAVVKYLEVVLERNPDHVQARQFLEQARRKIQ